MSFNSSRASANSIINRTLSNANGIGESKSAARSESGLKGANGHNVSDKAHSVKELQNLRSVTTQYINHVKDNFEGKVAGNINQDSLRSFIAEKMQEVSGGTLNTYLSTMNKVVDNLNKDSIGNLTRSDVQSVKEDVKQLTELRSEHINRAYDNVEAIRSEMNNTPFSLSSDLQHEAGLRVDDAINSNKWTLNNDNSLTIEGSKGGLDYTTAPLSTETAERVAEAIQENYKANYTEYKEALKEAVERTGQEWNGTHGLRYNFAQERIEELKAQGYTDDEAKGQTSLELGHSRLEITEHYAS